MGDHDPGTQIQVARYDYMLHHGADYMNFYKHRPKENYTLRHGLEQSEGNYTDDMLNP